MGKNVHIVKSKDGDEWSVKTEKSSKAYRNFQTQGEAISAGKELAKTNKSELLIHNKEGRIREKNTYGKDKYPPKG